MHVYVRTSGDLAQAASAITAVVKRLDPNLPIEDLETLPEQVRNNTFLDRMMTTLSAAFALSGDAARGDRSLWRARLYRRTAHARDRPPHGAWSRARPRSRHGAASGREHDARGSARGPRRRARRRQSGAVDSLSDDRCRSGGAGAFGRCARARRAMRRLHPRAPCVTSGSDEGAEIRIARNIQTPDSINGTAFCVGPSNPAPHPPFADFFLR